MAKYYGELCRLKPGSHEPWLVAPLRGRVFGEYPFGRGHSGEHEAQTFCVSVCSCSDLPGGFLIFYFNKQFCFDEAACQCSCLYCWSQYCDYSSVIASYLVPVSSVCKCKV